MHIDFCKYIVFIGININQKNNLIRRKIVNYMTSHFSGIILSTCGAGDILNLIILDVNRKYKRGYGNTKSFKNRRNRK